MAPRSNGAAILACDVFLPCRSQLQHTTQIETAEMQNSSANKLEDVRFNDLSPAKRALLEQRLRGHDTADARVLSTGDRHPRGFVPISADQQRIWLHAQTNPAVPLYNEAITVHRKGGFDPAVFERAFNEILRRHAAWRSSFGYVNGALAQITHHELRVQFPLKDLTKLSQLDREAAALQIAERDARVPFELEKAPLFRGHIVRMAPDEHRIYLTLHHIIFDGVSIYRIFMPELMEIYGEYSAGRNHSLAEPALQYGDYTLWRREQVSSAANARHIEYWKEQLSGELPVIDLPFDRPRPAQPSGRGAMECFQISNELIDKLRVLGQRQGVTLYMILLAAFKVLLFRLSGQEDLIVGGAADGRRLPELERTMGYMIDTIPIRTRPSANMRFDRFLNEVRDAVLGTLAAAEAPFDEIVKAIAQSRSGHSPIFQVFFSIEPPAPSFTGGWDLTQMDVTTGAAKFDLYLELDQQPKAMAARFLYNTDIFDPATVRRMADQWLVILEALPSRFNCSIGTFPLLTDAEMEQKIDPAAWNNTNQSYPQETLHALIEAQARLAPRATALVAGKQRWTYGELQARMKALSVGLRARGVKRGDLIAVHLQRSADMVAGLLAILKAGAAYMPLEPDAPAAQMALWMENSKPEFVLADRSAPDLMRSSASVLYIDELADSEVGLQQADFEADPDDLAYVIHTSGTTGIPKGVEITHRSLVNALFSFQQEPGFTARDRMLAITTISFDIAGLELFLPLISGGTVVLESRAVAADPQLLMAAIQRSQCTIMQATPVTWHSLIAAGWRGPGRPLKALCGGEAMSRELAKGLLERGVTLWNLYGPTEATIWVTMQRIELDDRPISIGKPIHNMTALVLDAKKQIVPTGVLGILHIGGVGLARGYRRNPEATRQRFVSVASRGGARLYDTGDIAVQRSDGSFECRGRSDHQVKVRGHRIELEAVEAAVRRHPQIAAAAARVWPDEAGSNRLSLYVVGKDGASPDAPELRRFLRQDQPEYMIPSDVMALDALPTTLNGKLDRSKLPPPIARKAAIEEDSRSVASPECGANVAISKQGIEATLAGWFQELLGIERVNPDDDFFALGGHSLVGVRLFVKIKNRYRLDLELATLIRCRTVRMLADEIRKSMQPIRENASRYRCLVPLQPQGSRVPFFLIHAVGGEVVSYEPLARELGSDRPLYALRSVLIAEEKIRETTIEEMASMYAREIRAFFPQGPYLLGGHSYGGLVAFEVARQLHSQGLQPELILLDAVLPGSTHRLPRSIQFLTLLANIRQQGFAYLMRKANLKREYLQQRWTRQVRFVASSILLRFGCALPAQLRYAVVEEMHLRALSRYEFNTYSGRIVLIRAIERGFKGIVSLSEQDDATLGWGFLSEHEVEVHGVPGDHLTMLKKPTLRIVAAEIKKIFLKLENSTENGYRGARLCSAYALAGNESD
jgi:amino acid adenylation domain-containing protein